MKKLYTPEISTTFNRIIILIKNKTAKKKKRKKIYLLYLVSILVTYFPFSIHIYITYNI